MKYSRPISALALSTMVLIAGCGKRDAAPAQAEAGSPHGMVMLAVGALRSGDFLGFLKVSMSEAEFAEARQEWEAARAEALDPEEEAELNATLALLRQDNAVEVIMSEIEPKLLEVQGQLPLLLGIAQTVGHAGIANSENLTDEQKTAANELLGAMGRWAGGRDLADPALARKAVTIAVEAGRSLDVDSAKELQALEFEEMLRRAGVMFSASKDVFAVYGIDINAMLDTVTAETLSQDEDSAEVRVRFRFLDTSQKIDLPVIRRDGRWYIDDTVSGEYEMNSGSREQA